MNRDWRSALCRHALRQNFINTDVVVFHKRFDLSEVCCTREFQFVSSWFTPISIKMSRTEKELFLRRLCTHFTLNVVFKNRGVINPFGNLTAYVYKAFFSIRFFSYPLYDWSDILLISSSERSLNLLYFSLSRVAPSTRALEIAALSVRLHLNCPLSPLERWSQWRMEWRMFMSR